MQTLLLLALQVSIFLAVLTIGMRTSVADLQYLFRRPGQLVRSLLAINVLTPIAAILICRTFSLHPAVIVGLVTLTLAPVSNLFSRSMLPLVAPGHMRYARGLFFASAVLSVILTPLAVEVIEAIYGGDAHVNPLAVAEVVITTLLLPLGIGLLIARWSPSARRWIAPIQKVSSLILLICAVIIIAGVWSVMTSVIRRGTVTAIVLIVLLDILAGHILGGPDEDDRTVLAHATVARHPGVAIVVASLTDQPLAPVGVLLAVLVSSIAVVPYSQWRKRRRSLAPGATAHPPTAAR